MCGARPGRPPVRDPQMSIGVDMAVAVLVSSCTPTPKDMVYDLARRVPVAERWSEHPVLLFGTPSAEPHLQEGFHREAGVGGEPFLWSKGEAEITLRFDAAAAPALPDGWTRDFMIYTDGWIKDADLNTAEGWRVGPLPFHAMSEYPYGPNEEYPRPDIVQRYHTRAPTPVPALAGPGGTGH